MKVILAGTSTGQCVATLLGVLQTNFGVAECHLTMIQANTKTDTNTLDDRAEGDMRDWRLGRGAVQNIIPCTNSDSLSEEVLQVTGWQGGPLITSSYLVPPTCPVSVVDLTVRLEREEQYSNVCERLRRLSQSGPLRRLLGYSQAALVSSDLVSDSHSAVLDSQAGHQTGPDTLRLVAW